MFKGIILKGLEKFLPIKKVTAINKISDKPLGRIYFKEMPDGTWRLTYTKHTIPDTTKLTSLEFVRDNDNELNKK